MRPAKGGRMAARGGAGGAWLGFLATAVFGLSTAGPLAPPRFAGTDRNGNVLAGIAAGKAGQVGETKAGRARRARTVDRVCAEPPYNVVLHNSWHPMSWVVYALVKSIPGTTVKKAVRVMWEAHTRGRAVAKTCHRELAELYEERLRGKGLTASVERPG